MKNFLNLSQNKIKQLAKLKQGKYRRLSGQYIISGLRAIKGCLQATGFSPNSVFVQQGKEHLLDELNLSNIQVPVYLLTENDFSRISDENNPQGIALLADCPVQQRQEQKPQSPVLIYLQEINDPGNLGSIIRSLLWFGFNEVLLSPGSVDPYSPKVVRASAGYISHCNIYQDITSQKLLELKESCNYRLYGTAADSTLEIKSFKPKKNERFILLFGPEAHGLSEELSALCEKMLTINRIGTGESLNLGVSAALFLYQIRSVLSVRR